MTERGHPARGRAGTPRRARAVRVGRSHDNVRDAYATPLS
jgi:hypothetical protein